MPISHNRLSNSTVSSQSASDSFDKVLGRVFGAGVIAILVSTLLSSWSSAHQASTLTAVIALIVVTLSVSLHSKMKTYAFAAWVICFVTVGIVYPARFIELGPIKGVWLISYLVQIAMFGMGATLTFQDFSRILRMPKPVAIGFILQFSCMPLLGWAISKCLQLPEELAIGVILVGSCPGGVASNVITYLAKGNVALSVTMTACTTLAAPIMTPLMMYLLASKSVPIDYISMMWNIFITIFVPVGAGLLVNILLNRYELASQTMDSYLAKLSMIAICLVCGVIAANSSNEIKTAGALLVVAVLLHNNIGYLLGYVLSKFMGCNEMDARTIAIEVGLQNGGMAAYLAISVIQKSSAAVAPAIFGSTMSVTGSLLAAWWSRSSNQCRPDQ